MAFCGVAAFGLIGVDNTASADHLGPASFPRVVIGLLFLLGAALVWQGFHMKGFKEYWPSADVLKRTAVFTAWFLLYIALVIGLGDFFVNLDIDALSNNMGFMVGSFIYLAGALYLTGRRRPIEICLVSLAVPACIVLSFSVFFKIMLP